MGSMAQVQWGGQAAERAVAGGSEGAVRGGVPPLSALDARQLHARILASLREQQRAERRSVIWFAELMARRLYREFGHSSIQQYAAIALGFSRAKTSYFVHLADAFARLPGLRAEVAAGRLGWTKARAVARVATPATEARWLEIARRVSRNELERRIAAARARARASKEGAAAVARAEPAAQPAPAVAPAQAAQPMPAEQPAPAVPALLPLAGIATAGGPGAEPETPITLTHRWTPVQYARYEALLERVRKVAAVPRGATREEILLAALDALGSMPFMTMPSGGDSAAGADPAAGDATATGTAATAPAIALAAAPAAAPAGPPAAAPAAAGSRYQIIIYKCRECDRGEVRTSLGARTLSPAQMAAVECDAAVLGDDGRNRATVPPAMRRAVLARDGHRCRAPGCGRTRFLEVHHRLPRERGGDNRPDNLITLCSACHRIWHELAATPNLARLFARAPGAPPAQETERSPGPATALDLASGRPGP